MDLMEIVTLHNKAKKRIYLQYRTHEDSRKKRWCYLDPSEPLVVRRTGQNYSHTRSDYPEFEKTLNHARNNNISLSVGVFKERNEALIFVEPINMWYHCPRKDSISKVLYGHKN